MVLPTLNKNLSVIGIVTDGCYELLNCSSPASLFSVEREVGLWNTSTGPAHTTGLKRKGIMHRLNIVAKREIWH